MSFAQKQEMIGKSATAAQKPEPEPLDPNYEYYTVKKGDTLWDIARSYDGVTVDQIKRLNSIRNSKRLEPGKKLKISVIG
jgi:membrane-bound lytic murein transglycosylase D